MQHRSTTLIWWRHSTKPTNNLLHEWYVRGTTCSPWLPAASYGPCIERSWLRRFRDDGVVVDQTIIECLFTYTHDDCKLHPAEPTCIQHVFLLPNWRLTPGYQAKLLDLLTFTWGLEVGSESQGVGGGARPFLASRSIVNHSRLSSFSAGTSKRPSYH